MQNIYTLRKKLVDERNEDYIQICLIEEMSELTKVLTKKLRGSEKYNEKDLEEEMSHVLLMCYTLKNKLNISDEAIYLNQMDALSRCFSNESKS